LKNVCILPGACAHVGTRGQKMCSVFHDSISNHLVDTNLFTVERWQPSTLLNERVAIHFLRWLTEHVASKLLYRSKSTNY